MDSAKLRWDICLPQILCSFCPRLKFISHNRIIFFADDNFVCYYRRRRPGDSNTIGEPVYGPTVEEMIVRGHDLARTVFVVHMIV